jgi:hypothetical protein
MRTFVFILFITLVGCTQDLPDKKALIEQYYGERRDALLARRKRDCIRSAENAAQVRVNAQIDRWINTKLFDTLNFPEKPIKPPTPDHVIDKVSKF